MMRMRSVGVLGGGAWGTALAMLAVRTGCDAVLWARDTATADEINSRHENSRRLAGVPLDPALRATSRLADVARSDALVLAVPAQTVRSVAAGLADLSPEGQPVVIAAKGFERGSDAMLSDVISEVLPAAVPAVLSGPSFAADVARGLPTAVTLACADRQTGQMLVEALGHTSFRPYSTTDLVGTQIGGAVKNVLAIACGIVAGRELGASALAALIARGFAEMSRLGQALGARPETLAGLSGLGDLVLTATDPQSRNFSFGRELGRGGSVQSVLDTRTAVTEGVWTAPAVVRRARACRTEMPICEAVAAVVGGHMEVDQAIEGLLARPFRAESE